MIGISYGTIARAWIARIGDDNAICILVRMLDGRIINIYVQATNYVMRIGDAVSWNDTELYWHPNTGRCVKFVLVVKQEVNVMGAWIGVDLDGTLAEYNPHVGTTSIGNPVPAMVDRVKAWIGNGQTVKIFTARVCDGEKSRDAIEKWCEEHIGQKLEITNVKDYGMIELWDDRVVRVKTNTGEVV
jgi:hypothetical protein